MREGRQWKLGKGDVEVKWMAEWRGSGDLLCVGGDNSKGFYLIKISM